MKLYDHIRTEMYYRGVSSTGNAPTISCGFMRKDKKTLDESYGFYDRFAVVYVLRGSGSYLDHKRVSHLLKPGSVFIRHPFREHSNTIAPDSHWAECFLSLTSNFITVLNDLGIRFQERHVYQAGLKLDWVERFEACLSRVKEAEEWELGKVQLQLLDFVIDIMNTMQTPINQRSNKPLISKACRILSENLDTRAPLPEVFSGLNLSYTRLRMLFKQSLGVSPGDYLIRLRIEKACALLAQGELNVKEIAERLGYPDAYTFSKQFKKQMGQSPLQFKRRS